MGGHTLGIGGVIGGLLAATTIALAVGGGLGMCAGVGIFSGSFFAGQYLALKDEAPSSFVNTRQN
jgi:hypothetical protein